MYPVAPIFFAVRSDAPDALLAVWMEGQYGLGKGQDACVLLEEDCLDQAPTGIRQAVSWMDRYFQGQKPDPKELKLRMEVSDFQRAVLEELQKIPYGQLTTYGAIAQKIAADRGIRKMSAQAVGGAVGHNPFAIVIPCHRVVGAGGRLTGYTGGLDKKIRLLRHEEVDLSDYDA